MKAIASTGRWLIPIISAASARVLAELPPLCTATPSSSRPPSRSGRASPCRVVRREPVEHRPRPELSLASVASRIIDLPRRRTRPVPRAPSTRTTTPSRRPDHSRSIGGEQRRVAGEGTRICTSLEGPACAPHRVPVPRGSSWTATGSIERRGRARERRRRRARRAPTPCGTSTHQHAAARESRGRCLGTSETQPAGEAAPNFSHRCDDTEAGARIRTWVGTRTKTRCLPLGPRPDKLCFPAAADRLQPEHVTNVSSSGERRRPAQRPATLRTSRARSLGHRAETSVETHRHTRARRFSGEDARWLRGSAGEAAALAMRRTCAAPRHTDAGRSRRSRRRPRPSTPSQHA